MSSPPLMIAQIHAVVSRLQSLAASLPPGQQRALAELLTAAGMRETSPLQYNPCLPGVHESPHSHYARLLQENPIHWSATMGAWVLTRYDDVLAALHEPCLSKAGTYRERLNAVPPHMRDQMEAYCRFTTSTLSFLDPPEHGRLRAIIVRALARDFVVRMMPPLAAAVDAMVDAMLERDEMDLMRDVATPLARLVGGRLLGVPEGDQLAVATLVEDLTQAFSNGDDAERLRRGADALPTLVDYFVREVRARARTQRDDAMTAMIRGGEATEAELVSLCIQILLGGIESIRQLVGVGMLALLTHGQQAERLRAALEETLRYDPVTAVLRRIAQADLVLRGVTIRAGDPVLLLVAAANRDPERFAGPDRLDIDRRPNSHLAFGAGLHYCPGAALSRMTGTIAIGTLLRRLPGLCIAPAGIAWRDEINARGLRSLRVALAHA